MKKTYDHPLQINLTELPPEGRDCEYTEERSALRQALEDLLGHNTFKVNFHLQPMGNAFEIRGEVHSMMDLLCSRCGRDMKYPLEEKFHEILLVEEDTQAGRNSSDSDLGQEQGPFCNFLPSGELDVKEYVHELVAANEPYQPYCDEKDCAEEAAKYQVNEDFTAEAESSPFSALKALKIDPKSNKH